MTDNEAGFAATVAVFTHMITVTGAIGKGIVDQKPAAGSCGRCQSADLRCRDTVDSQDAIK